MRKDLAFGHCHFYLKSNLAGVSETVFKITNINMIKLLVFFKLSVAGNQSLSWWSRTCRSGGPGMSRLTPSTSTCSRSSVMWTRCCLSEVWLSWEHVHAAAAQRGDEIADEKFVTNSMRSRSSVAKNNDCLANGHQRDSRKAMAMAPIVGKYFMF